MSIEGSELFTVSGTNDPVGDLHGVTTIVGEQNINISGCVVLCAGWSPTYSGGELVGTGWATGSGGGYELGVDIVSVEDYVYYVHPGKDESRWSLPILNKNFLTKVYQQFKEFTTGIFK